MDPGELTTDVWAVEADEFPVDGSAADQARFLVRYAVLAPSSHNAQPWSFRIRHGGIDVFAAEERRLAVADPDRRELHIGLGCAVETLRIAARRFGFGPRVVSADEGAPVARIEIGPGGNPRLDAALFDAITERYTEHRPFDDTTVSAGTLADLRDSTAEFDATLRFVEGRDRKRSIADLQARADRRLAASRAYREELARWIGSGALGGSRLRARVGQAVVTHLDIGDREARHNAALIEEAPVVGVLVTDGDGRRERLGVGRAFQRLSLAATDRGLAVHPLSQILERPTDRASLRALVDADGRPQHLFRLGYVDGRQGHTPRLPAETVIED